MEDEKNDDIELHYQEMNDLQNHVHKLQNIMNENEDRNNLNIDTLDEY